MNSLIHFRRFVKSLFFAFCIALWLFFLAFFFLAISFVPQTCRRCGPDLWGTAISNLLLKWNEPSLKTLWPIYRVANYKFIYIIIIIELSWRLLRNSQNYTINKESATQVLNCIFNKCFPLQIWAILFDIIKNNWTTNKSKQLGKYMFLLSITLVCIVRLGNAVIIIFTIEYDKQLLKYMKFKIILEFRRVAKKCPLLRGIPYRELCPKCCTFLEFLALIPLGNNHKFCIGIFVLFSSLHTHFADANAET